MNLENSDTQEELSDKIHASQLNLVKYEFDRAKDYASEYDQSNTPINHFFNTRLKRVSELLNDFKSGKILDLGCGPAKIAKSFHGFPIEYYGLDVSEEMLKEAIGDFGHDPQFHFFLGDIEKLPFSHSCFDVVLCLGTFEYVLDGHAAIREIIRVLKPEGIFIITMLNGKGLYRICKHYTYWKLINGIKKFIRLVVRSKRNLANIREDRPKTTIYAERDLRNLLTEKGLRIEDVVYYDFRVLLSPLDTLLPKVSVFLSKNLEFLCRSKFKFFASAFILKFRKN